jgi:hypothetical protein
MTIFWVLIVLVLHGGPKEPTFQTWQTKIACKDAADEINAQSPRYHAFCVQDGVAAE